MEISTQYKTQKVVQILCGAIEVDANNWHSRVLHCLRGICRQAYHRLSRIPGCVVVYQKRGTHIPGYHVYNCQTRSLVIWKPTYSDDTYPYDVHGFCRKDMSGTMYDPMSLCTGDTYAMVAFRFDARVNGNGGIVISREQQFTRGFTGCIDILSITDKDFNKSLGALPAHFRRAISALSKPIEVGPMFNAKLYTSNYWRVSTNSNIRHMDTIRVVREVGVKGPLSIGDVLQPIGVEDANQAVRTGVTSIMLDDTNLVHFIDCVQPQLIIGDRLARMYSSYRPLKHMPSVDNAWCILENVRDNAPVKQHLRPASSSSSSSSTAASTSSQSPLEAVISGLYL